MVLYDNVDNDNNSITNIIIVDDDDFVKAILQKEEHIRRSSL